MPQGNITRRNLLRFAGIAAATAAISATGCAEKADESRLQTILDAMSLEQKIAQMINKKEGKNDDNEKDEEV